MSWKRSCQLDGRIVWASLKKELVCQTHFTTQDEARLEIFDWIQLYNRKRPHWTNRLPIADSVRTSR
ncbi:MAG: IS3 family transposase [Ferrimicrobium acidiphilum]